MTAPPPSSPRAQARLQQAQLLRAGYEHGATVTELAQRSGLSYGTVINRLRTARTPMRTGEETRRMRTNPDTVAARQALSTRLRAHYETGATVQELATANDLSTRTVRRLLVTAGTTLRAPHQTRRLRTAKTAADRHTRATTLRTRRDAGETVTSLATDQDCSNSTVYRLLREATTPAPGHTPSSPAPAPT